MKRRTLIAMVVLGGACAAPLQQAPAGDDGLLALLPDPVDLQGITPSGAPEQAAGDDLFALINGGAEMYLRHGFDRALAQEYRGTDGVLYNLEIYRMTDDAGAAAIYARKGGTRDASPAIGDASTFEDYYGLYLTGRHYITVTASRTEGVLRPTIEKIARAVVQRVATPAHD